MQRLTTIININLTKQPYDVYIGRGSLFGNPFYIGVHGNRKEVIELYKQYILNSPELLKAAKALKGKVLGCHCKPAPCHGDILVNIANGVLKVYNKLIIGIDQSYTRTGIAIAADGKLLKVSSLAFKGLHSPTEKRKHLTNVLTRILDLNAHKASECYVICERIRTFSHNNNDNSQNQMFISTNYIKSAGALVATIVDVANSYGVKVYSADTRSWKAQIVGTSKASQSGNKKLATIKHVINLGFSSSVTSVNRNGKTVYDDDACDAACIALYGFHKNQKLKIEK